MPTVKFDPSLDDQGRQVQKRRRDESQGFEAHEQDRKKKKKLLSFKDENEEIDETKHNDSDEDQTVPSEKELLEAKRRRRQNRAGLDDDGRTYIDDKTSLASDGITIEPFHMKNEESDGTGFFDGDTYIFRRHNAEDGEDGEPDAWLDKLRDDAAEGKNMEYQVPKTKPKAEQSRRSMDDLSREQLYQKVIPLLNDDETVSRALMRYGRLIKGPHGSKTGPSATTPTSSQSTAKTYLNDLTGAANALLLRGEIMIYQSTKESIQRCLPRLESTASIKPPNEKQPPAEWEYRGNQDGALHGPYTTEQLIDWTKAGYFIGEQRVQIRTIRRAPKQLSTQDDLLKDLMDDDEEDDDGLKGQIELVRGEWQWSNEVDFVAYLPVTSA